MDKFLTWEDRYALARIYYEHHGNLRVVSSFKTKDGHTYDENGFKLGVWVARQRYQYKINELTEEHYEKLSLIGMVFEDINEFDWNNFYSLAQIYLNYHKTPSIPGNFKTKNGYEEDKTGKDLGAWFNVQKMNYQHKKLSEERMQKIKR